MSGFFGTTIIRPPTPSVVKRHIGGSHYLPIINSATSTYDGSMVKLPESADLAFKGYDKTGTLQWTVDIAAVQAASGLSSIDTFSALYFYDSTNELIYTIGWVSSSGTWALMTIGTASGAVTGLGSLGVVRTPATKIYDNATHSYGVKAGFMKRETMTSGDFTIYDGKKYLTCSSTTGAITTAFTDFAIDSYNVTGNVSYVTHAGDLAVLTGSFILDSTTYKLIINRGGQKTTLKLGGQTIGLLPGTATYCGVRLWGDYVMPCMDYTTIGLIGPLAFARSEFDTWLGYLADKAGLPA